MYQWHEPSFHNHQQNEKQVEEELRISECVYLSGVQQEPDGQLSGEEKAEQVLSYDEPGVGFGKDVCMIEFNVDSDPNRVEEYHGHGDTLEHGMASKPRII